MVKQETMARKLFFALIVLALMLFEKVQSDRSKRNPQGRKCPYSLVNFEPLNSKDGYLHTYESLKEKITNAFSFFWRHDDSKMHLLSADTVESMDYCPGGGPVTCDPSAPYRNHDGTCTNLDHPTWGRSNECQLRLLPPEYEGVNSYRRSVVDNKPLPEPRDLSINIMTVADRPIPELTSLSVFIGQFAAHDIVETTTPTNNSIPCCPYNDENRARPECDPIFARPDDPYYSQFNNTCITFERSNNCTACETSEKEKAQKINHVTAVLDLSQVYGTSKDQADGLRTKDGTGKLITDTSDGQGELLPPNPGTFSEFCVPEVSKCFFAGDQRLDQHAGLTSLHTVFLRQHNRLVGELKQLNPKWEEEKLYQEARKIMGGQWQHIVYNEYLPPTLGSRHMDHFGLWVDQSPRYNASIRPSIFIEFSTAAFRLHSLVTRLTGLSGLRFFETYMHPELLRDGCIDGILKGASSVRSQQFDRHFEVDMDGQFNRLPFMKFGLDSSSIDIQRGRDHGMPSYGQALKLLTGGQTDVQSFDDLLQFMTPDHVRLLQDNYDSVHDVDLWVGLQLEKLAPGSILGLNSATLTALQFHHIKYGDRFYYEYTGEGAAFTPAQIAALKENSLARILCDNTNLKSIQKHPMQMPSHENPILTCDEITKMDLTPWKTNA